MVCFLLISGFICVVVGAASMVSKKNAGWIGKNYIFLYFHFIDCLFGIVVSTSDCHPRGPGFDSQLYSGNFCGGIGSGTGSTQPREDNWVTT